MALGGSQFLIPQEILDLAGLGEGAVAGHLGAGAGGYFTIPMSYQVGITGKVYAVDIFEHVLQSIQARAKKENLTNIEYVISNIEKVGATNIKEKSLDYTFLINVLFQNTDHESILKEAVRLTHQDGIIVIVDWKISQVGFGPTPDKLVPQAKLIEIMTKMGIQLVSQTEVGDYHYALVFRR